MWVVSLVRLVFDAGFRFCLGLEVCKTLRYEEGEGLCDVLLIVQGGTFGEEMQTLDEGIMLREMNMIYAIKRIVNMTSAPCSQVSVSPPG